MGVGVGVDVGDGVGVGAGAGAGLAQDVINGSAATIKIKILPNTLNNRFFFI